MKAKLGPALRRKRGLRRASAAEPPGVGLTPQTTKKQRASTMKTYILRTPKTVEPQTAARPRRPGGPVACDAAKRGGFIRCAAARGAAPRSARSTTPREAPPHPASPCFRKLSRIGTLCPISRYSAPWKAQKPSEMAIKCLRCLTECLRWRSLLLSCLAERLRWQTFVLR